MVQTDLLSDNFCGYNTSAAPMYWTLDPIQNRLQYNFGTVGVPTGVGLNTPSEVIDVSSFLSDRQNLLTKCIPPAPPALSQYGNASDASIQTTNNELNIPVQGTGENAYNMKKIGIAQFNNENILTEGFQNESGPDANSQVNYSGLINARGEHISELLNPETFLTSDASNGQLRGSGKDLSAVNLQAGFGGNHNNLHTDPQNLTYVIERMWLERGGLDANQNLKQAWNNNTPPRRPDNKIDVKTTCEKIRRPYPIDAPFGLDFNNPLIPYAFNPENRLNASDVVSNGRSSPLFDQNNSMPFDEKALFTNGGCNPTSMVNQFGCNFPL